MSTTPKTTDDAPPPAVLPPAAPRRDSPAVIVAKLRINAASADYLATQGPAGSSERRWQTGVAALLREAAAALDALDADSGACARAVRSMGGGFLELDKALADAQEALAGTTRERDLLLAAARDTPRLWWSLMERFGPLDPNSELGREFPLEWPTDPGVREGWVWRALAYRREKPGRPEGGAP